MLDLADKEFNSAIINMLKELKKNMFKELKESIVTMSHQIENINEKIRIIQNNQMKILELKYTISEMKSSLQGLNSDWSWQKSQNQSFCLHQRVT